MIRHSYIVTKLSETQAFRTDCLGTHVRSTGDKTKESNIYMYVPTASCRSGDYSTASIDQVLTRPGLEIHLRSQSV
jgi:hypothetical protein